MLHWVGIDVKTTATPIRCCSHQTTESRASCISKVYICLVHQIERDTYVVRGWELAQIAYGKTVLVREGISSHWNHSRSVVQRKKIQINF